MRDLTILIPSGTEETFLTGSPVEVSREASTRLLSDFLANGERDYRRIRGISGIGKSSFIEKVFESYLQGENASKLVGEKDYRELDVEELEETLLSLLPQNLRRDLEEQLRELFPKRQKSSPPKLRFIVRHVQGNYDANDKLVIRFSVSKLGEISQETLESLKGAERAPVVKWLLEERSDLGPIPTPTQVDPKPFVNIRPDWEKVIYVHGWSDSEVRDYVSSKFKLPLGGDTEALERIGDAIIKWAGGHPDLVSSMCKWLMNHLMGLGNNWRDATRSVEDLELVVEHEAQANAPTLRRMVEVICEHLTARTKDFVSQIVREDREIDTPPIFGDLKRAGLATQNRKLVKLLRLFHESSPVEEGERLLELRTKIEGKLEALRTLLDISHDHVLDSIKSIDNNAMSSLKQCKSTLKLEAILELMNSEPTDPEEGAMPKLKRALLSILDSLEHQKP
jgi:hypothetical protein